MSVSEWSKAAGEMKCWGSRSPAILPAGSLGLDPDGLLLVSTDGYRRKAHGDDEILIALHTMVGKTGMDLKLLSARKYCFLQLFALQRHNKFALDFDVMGLHFYGVGGTTGQSLAYHGDP